MGEQQTNTSKTLVIGVAWVGDMVMSSSLFQSIVQQGNGPIDLVVPPWSAGIAKLMPEVANIIILDIAHGKLGWTKRKKLGISLRNKGYERAYVQPSSFKAALVPWWANIPKRIGWRGEMRYGLLTDIYPHHFRKQHTADRYTAISLPFNTDFETIIPKLHVEKELIDKVKKQHNLGNDKPMIAICPGAAKQDKDINPKIWALDNYSKLLKMLVKDYKIILLGSPSDMQYTDLLINDLDSESKANTINLAGEVSIEETAAVLSLCAGAVANDSGLMHLAAALETPTVGIFIATDPRHNQPLGKNAHFVEPANRFMSSKDVEVESVFVKINLAIEGRK